MFFRAREKRLEFLILSGKRHFLRSARFLRLLSERRHGSLEFLFLRIELGALLGEFLITLAFGTMNLVFNGLYFFLFGGQLSFRNLFSVFKLPFEFFFGFLKLEPFFGELFGQAIEFPLAFGFLA